MRQAIYFKTFYMLILTGIDGCSVPEEDVDWTKVESIELVLYSKDNHQKLLPAEVGLSRELQETRWDLEKKEARYLPVQCFADLLKQALRQEGSARATKACNAAHEQKADFLPVFQQWGIHVGPEELQDYRYHLLQDKEFNESSMLEQFHQVMAMANEQKKKQTEVFADVLSQALLPFLKKESCELDQELKSWTQEDENRTTLSFRELVLEHIQAFEKNPEQYVKDHPVTPTERPAGPSMSIVQGPEGNVGENDSGGKNFRALTVSDLAPKTVLFFPTKTLPAQSYCDAAARALCASISLAGVVNEDSEYVLAFQQKHQKIFSDFLQTWMRDPEKVVRDWPVNWSNS